MFDVALNIEQMEGYNIIKLFKDFLRYFLPPKLNIKNSSEQSLIAKAEARMKIVSQFYSVLYMCSCSAHPTLVHLKQEVDKYGFGVGTNCCSFAGSFAVDTSW